MEMKYEMKNIGMNKFRVTHDEKLISMIFNSKLKFGVEDYLGKNIINFEISKKIEKKIREIESFIFIQTKFVPYSSIRINKKNIFLKPLLRTSLKYKKDVITTIIKNSDNNIINIKDIKRDYKLKIHIYLDHVWTIKNKIGLCWYIDLIDKRN
jgi:hypothetical protein